MSRVASSGMGVPRSSAISQLPAEEIKMGPGKVPWFQEC